MADAKYIWDYLIKEIKNPFGVAGLMGNLEAESNLNPLCKTGGDKSISGKQYAEMVDNEEIDREHFIQDEVAFGLVQWRYWSRKDSLYAIWLAQRAGTSIGDLDFQLEYLLFEIEEFYHSVWDTLKNATSVKEASDIVMLKYEKPGNTSDTAKNKRASMGLAYYTKYAEQKSDDKPADEPKGKYVRTTMDRVFIRQGNGKDYVAYTRIEKKGTQFKWVASSENNWHAVEFKISKNKYIGWISGECSELY